MVSYQRKLWSPLIFSSLCFAAWDISNSSHETIQSFNCVSLNLVPQLQLTAESLLELFHKKTQTCMLAYTERQQSKWRIQGDWTSSYLLRFQMIILVPFFPIIASSSASNFSSVENKECVKMAFRLFLDSAGSLICRKHYVKDRNLWMK